MDHSVHNRRGDDGVTEVVAELLEVDVRSEHGRPFGVPAVDDLEKESGVSCVLSPLSLSFQAVETKLVDYQKLRVDVLLELLIQRVIGQGREECLEHVRRRGVTDPVAVFAALEGQDLGDVAFTRTAVAGQNYALASGHEAHGEKLQHQVSVEPGLEVEIKLDQRLSFGKLGLTDAPLHTPLSLVLHLSFEQAKQRLGGR